MYTNPWKADSKTIKDDMDKLLSEVFKHNYAKKVNFIGHSFGGLVARYYASIRPENVNKVITVGAPHKGATLFYEVAFSMSKEEIEKKLPPHSVIRWTIPTYDCTYLRNKDGAIQYLDPKTILPDLFENTLKAGPAPGVRYYSIYSSQYDSPKKLFLKEKDGWYEVVGKESGPGDAYILAESARAFGIPLPVLRNSPKAKHALLLNDEEVQKKILALLSDKSTGNISLGDNETHWFKDTIRPSKTISYTVSVDSGIAKVAFNLSWRGSDLDLILYDPNGAEINPQTAAMDPSIEFVEVDNYEQYTVLNPIPGNWTMEVRAIDVPEEGEEYQTAVYMQTGLRFGYRINAGLDMFSLPMESFVTNIWQLLNSSPSETQLAVWNPEKGGYIYSRDNPQAEIFQVVAGRAYWIKANAPIELSVLGALPIDALYIPLKRGWNQVGYLANVAMTWSLETIKVAYRGEEKTLEQAQQAGWIEDYAWGWEQDANNPNEGRYVLVYDTSIIPGVKGQLEPWKGYWVYAHTNCELVLPPPSQGKGRGTRGEGRMAKGNGWSMRLQASVNGSVGEAVLGIANGTRGLAVGLPPEPPTGNNGVQVILLKNNTPLAVDVRSDGARRQEWEVLVRWDKGQVTRGMGERKEVVLTFDGIGYAPKDVSAWLVDTVTGKRLYLRTQPSYRFVAQEGEVERKFKVVVERGNDRPLRVVGLKATPMRGQGVVIEFSLTKPAKVEAEVLTLTGRKVAILDAGSSEGLTRRVVWRGVGIEGQKVGGVYLVRVRAVDEEGREVQAATVVRLR